MEIVQAKYFISLTYFFLFVCLFIGCSKNPTANDSDKISTKVNNKGIDVSSKLTTSIYYFVIEQKLAAHTNWAPTSGPENQIKPLSKKLIPFSDIGDYEKDKKFIFYYWKTKNPTQKDIKRVLVNL